MSRFCKTFEQESWSPLGLGQAVLEAERGFWWGYADLLDSEGSGLVCIWANALPFEPGVLSAERSGAAVVPARKPSISLAVYERGACVFYLLRALTEDQVGGTSAGPALGGKLRFGGLNITRTAGRLHVEITVAVRGDGPLEGSFWIEGPELAFPVAGASAHRWAPQIIGKSRAELRFGGKSLVVEGRGYHDRNGSRLGLSELGIERWIWGRTPLPNGELVHYLLESDRGEPEQNHVLWIDDRGVVEHQFVEVERGPERRGRWGLYSPSNVRAGDLEIEHISAFEDGPFYQRHRTRVRHPGGEHFGVGEVVVVPRIDAGWMRPLVRMALDGPRPSIWMPLFAGPTRGGLQRLFRSWTES